MENYVILTDSSCDLGKELAEELDLHVISLEAVFDNGTTKLDSEIDVKEFYQQLREKVQITTSAVGIDRFLNFIEPFLAEGKDVLYLGFTSGLSGTFNAGFVASQELSEKYPDRKVYAVDTLCASLGQGLIVKLAVDKKNAGATIDEVAAYVEEIKLNLCHWFTVEDLFFLKRGGRVSAATAVMGTVLQIKPVMHVDDDGKLINVEKARGRIASIGSLFAKMKETAINPESQTVYISHGDCYDDAKKLADMITAEFGITDILISEVGPVIGAHSGPGTLALFFLGSKR